MPLQAIVLPSGQDNTFRPGDSPDSAAAKTAANFAILAPFAAHGISAPVTGATVAMAAGEGSRILNPAGTLATLTVNLPPNPVDSQIARISSTKALTALTVGVTDGSTVNGAPTALAANAGFVMMYDKAANTWFPSA